MMSNNRYQRIGVDDHAVEAATEMTVLAVPSAPEEQFNPVIQQATATFSVKILLKEKVFEISGLSDNMRVGELKSSIEAASTVPSAQQRLICAGKQLKPDMKTLAEFKVTPGSSIHLFPLPPPTQAVPVASAVEGTSTFNPITAHGVSGSTATGTGEVAHRPIHFDPQINQTSREVKLWCLILMFLSGMTLFNNLSFVGATGKFGQGTLDSIVTVIDTLTSALGLVVGNMGLQSVRTMEIGDVNKYVRALVSLAMLAVILRVLWVVDVILQVQKVVRDSQEEDTTGGKDNDKPPTTDIDDPAAGQKLDDRTVVSFGVQACIIALICIFAWGSCVVRARRLQSEVANYNNAMQV